GAPRRVVASADGRRVVVADPTADEFTGSVAIYAFDGCDLASDDAIVPGRGGVASALVGTGVGLSDDGETLLVSARGAAQAWVFDLDSGLTTAESGPAATLGTARETAGFGASAALSGDGRIAVVGASDGSAKGAALLYLVAAATGSEDAVALPTADLGRDAGVGVGAEVAVSAGGDVVATSLLTGGSAPRAAALVWDTAVSGAWALGADGQASVVTESARLVASTGPPLDGVAHLAMARDGRTIALSAAQGGGSLLVFVFERAGATWGDASDGSVQIAETATLRLTASPAWRFALASDGSVLAGADPDGGRFFARPAGGFQTNAPGVAVEGATLRGWPTFSGGDHVIIGVAPDGALIARWLL
ncbi:MAG: hypothetical protein KC635_17575, partial [Myxococcales bacterium]|nr:hypothetical protein [Myxococcales bacterium]